MFPKEIFSQRLRQLRTQNKLSMQQLADQIGLKNKGTICQFETGVTIPASATLIALADYFDVSVDYLVGRADTPGKNVKASS